MDAAFSVESCMLLFHTSLRKHCLEILRHLRFTLNKRDAESGLLRCRAPCPLSLVVLRCPDVAFDMTLKYKCCLYLLVLSCFYRFYEILHKGWLFERWKRFVDHIIIQRETERHYIHFMTLDWQSLAYFALVNTISQVNTHITSSHMKRNAACCFYSVLTQISIKWLDWAIDWAWE